MSMEPEVRAEFGEALKQKLERRFRRATQRGAPGAYDPKAAMDNLVRLLSGELEGEEARRRQAGDEAAAKAFEAVRLELLGQVAADVLATHHMS